MRYCKDWLLSYKEYVDLIKHESPSNFHLWVAMSTIAAALERKVWYKLVRQDLYSNMYVILVAPPGTCRKGGAISLGKHILLKIADRINISAERMSLEILINDMVASKNIYQKGSQFYTHSSLTAISKELSVFLRVKDTEFIPNLCDLYDCEDHWEYKTFARGTDAIDGVWLNILAATIPPGFANSIPIEVIGSGLSARSIFVYANQKQRSNILSIKDKKIEELEGMLIEDLKTINLLCGDYCLQQSAEDALVSWYNGLPHDISVPEYITSFRERKHAHVLKVSMIIAASRRDELEIKLEDLQAAISIVESIEPSLYTIFSSVGRNIEAVDVNNILYQIRQAGPIGISKDKIMRGNMSNLNPRSLQSVLETLKISGDIKEVQLGNTFIYRILR